AYSEEDWHIMTSAYVTATFLLKRSISNNANAARLAREIMHQFNTGNRDVTTIASVAADGERRAEVGK
ncbi:MAG: hypothetical protein AAAB35_10400, partial [Phyllobacterium sp.]|uniref:hypothetical protein n=1 Tax=Phyllobacterium sp. TaxID=1871046 RepID=UPI0030EFE7B7